MDFEIKNHFFPSMYVNVYDNLLDVKFAAFEHCLCWGTVRYRTLGLFPDSVGGLGDLG